MESAAVQPTTGAFPRTSPLGAPCPRSLWHTHHVTAPCDVYCCVNITGPRRPGGTLLLGESGGGVFPGEISIESRMQESRWEDTIWSPRPEQNTRQGRENVPFSGPTP